jgi:hypothetical protein
VRAGHEHNEIAVRLRVFDVIDPIRNTAMERGGRLCQNFEMPSSRLPVPGFRFNGELFDDDCFGELALELFRRQRQLRGLPRCRAASMPLNGIRIRRVEVFPGRLDVVFHIGWLRQPHLGIASTQELKQIGM